MKYTRIAALLSLLAVLTVFAQEPPPKEGESEAAELLTGVQDNSFLIEEAYNQEPGIVQHINVLEYDSDHKTWEYAFTQEWPLFSMKHQLSYTLPLDNLPEDGEDEDDFGLGDIMLNYRYQLVGNGESRVAVSPRLSVILPTGDDQDKTAFEVGLPISTILGPRVLAHTNFVATWLNEEDADNEYLVGQSLIYTMTPRVNALVEALWRREDEGDSIVVSPGVRWAYNLASGSQIVPGIAYEIVVDSDDKEESNKVLLYFSYENAFGRH